MNNKQQDYNLLTLVTIMIFFFMLCTLMLALHIDYEVCRIIQLLP